MSLSMYHDHGRLTVSAITVERIGLGQYVEAREVFELVASALESQRAGQTAIGDGTDAR